MLIYLVLIILGIINILYLPTKFFGEHLPTFFTTFYESAKENWALLIFLEFVMMVSLFFDIITRYDKIKMPWRTIQLILTAIFMGAFILKFFMGYTELYIDGKIE
ncbi:MAG: hypothetical protein SGI87_05960 [Flavobacteriales bacterium]|nr:hypothetical protein [Flavobacteriales bacterium]